MSSTATTTLSLALLLGAGALPSSAQTGMTDGGIQFPDGSVQSSAAVEPANVLQVAKSGVPFRTIRAALRWITDAGPDNPYLIQVGPGIYSERLRMKPHVDIEGAGAGRTVITSPGGGIDAPTLWTAADSELRKVTVRSTDVPGLDATAVRCASRGRLRDVTVEAIKGATVLANARGIYAWLCEELVLWRVTVESSGSAGGNSALFINTASSPGPTLRVYDSDLSAFGADGNDASAIAAQGSVFVKDTSLSATGAANVNSGFFLGGQHDSQVQLDEVTITVGPATVGAGIGIWMSPAPSASTIQVDGSSISSADYSVKTRSGVSVLVGASRLDGDVDTSSGGSATCVASYDGTYQALDEACLPPGP